MKTTLLCLLLLPLTLGIADETGRPKVTAQLCQNWDQKGLPEASTTTFYADSPSVRVVFQSEAPIPVGQRTTPAICVDQGGPCVELFRGDAFVGDGKSNLIGQGFTVAGRTWAQSGGRFRFRVYWNDEAEPLVDIPFTIVAGNRWALLVGISDYPPAGAGGQDLPASDKDAQRMKELLEASFGFSPDRITLVQNLDATSARLDRELTALADKAGPDDAVLFYYCGHGTQVPDLDGDEEDGWDEALATADVSPALMTTPDHLKLVLTDDRIAQLLARFKTKNVTVIFDSCHSGTAVRAGDEGETRIDAPGFFFGMRKEVGIGRDLVQMAEDANRSAPTGIAAGLDIDQRFVFLSAARSWETGMTDGEGCFFSRYLRDAIRSSNGQSWEQILDGVRPLVQQQNPGQSPQVAGAMRRFPFSLAEAPEDAPFQRPAVAVAWIWRPEEPDTFYYQGTAGQTALVSGMDSLYQENARVVYDAYAEGASTPRGRVTLSGKLQMIPRENSSPLAYASATIDEGTVGRGDRLIPRTVPVPQPRPSIGLCFFNSATPALIQQLQGVVNAVLGLLGKENAVRLVTSGTADQLDYVIVPTLVDGTFVASLFTPLSQQVGTCKGTPQEIATMLRDFVVQRHSEYTRINRIHNPSPPFRLRTVLDGGEGRRAPGGKLTCRGYVGAPAYLYAFAAMEGGQTRLVAASDAPLAPDLPFNFEVTTEAGRKGRMVVRVFATERPLDKAALLKAAAGSRADVLLRELTKACPAKGSPGALGSDGWASHALWIELR